jgi:hypothetical protein
VGAARDVGSAAKTFFMSAPLPAAWFASVAIPRGLGADLQAVAVGLVAALRERTDPNGRKLTVVATIESAEDMFIRRLLGRGAFVVRGAPDAGSGGGERLHHFPSRAVITPRRGRLISIDSGDLLSTWRPGWVGELHVLPFTFGEGATASREHLIPHVGITPRGLNVLFHLDLHPPGSPLAEIDRFATRCEDELMLGEGVVIFTDTDRVDEPRDSIDLLIITDALLPIANPSRDG